MKGRLQTFSDIAEKSNPLSAVHQFKSQKRTDGDGMEKEDINVLDNAQGVEKSTLRDQLIYRPVDLKKCSLPAPPVAGKMINLTPKICTAEKKKVLNIRISKEPKFVPYEPYKAATNPITKNSKQIKDKFVRFTNKHLIPNVEDLIQVNKLSITTEKNQNEQNLQFVSNSWEEEKQTLLNELDMMRKKNTELENQVQFQTRVNAELKKLLVAAVGEDIETRVQLLTEDKLHLAKQLLSTAKTLSTHQEQIEWLAGQSEVWRSKFLASSMLVEDLARWKARLCHKVTNYQSALKSLLEDNDVIRRDTFQIFINLSTLQEKFNLDVVSEDNDECQLITADTINLCSMNRKLSNLLMSQLLGENIVKKKFELDPLNCVTASEKYAEQVLTEPIIPVGHSDVACSAVMNGAAQSRT